MQEGDPLLATDVLKDTKHHVMPCAPSIENLVREWYDGAVRVLEPEGIRVVNIRGYETETCWADYAGWRG